MPPGQYYVYAQSDFLDEFNKTHYKAYHTEYSVCGGGSECDRHEALVVQMVAGQTDSGVIPRDWQEIG